MANKIFSCHPPFYNLSANSFGSHSTMGMLGNLFFWAAAGPVSPVSTWSLFPSSGVAPLLQLISAITQRMPTQGPQVHTVRWHFKTCEMAVNSERIKLFCVFLPTTYLSCKRMITVSQASSAKEVACEISEQSEGRNQYCTTEWKEKVDIHTYE